MKRFDILKPVENHPDHICCTDCWQRGIEWGSAGEQERIIDLLEAEHQCEPYFCGIHQVIALIKRES